MCPADLPVGRVLAFCTTSCVVRVGDVWMLVFEVVGVDGHVGLVRCNGVEGTSEEHSMRNLCCAVGVRRGYLSTAQRSTVLL